MALVRTMAHEASLVILILHVPVDTISASLELESGAVGTWAMTHASSRSDAIYQIVGTQGMLVLDNLTKLRHHKANGTSTLRQSSPSRLKRACNAGEVLETVFDTTYGGAKQDLVDEFKDFHRCIMRARDSSLSASPDKAVGKGDEEGFVMLPHGPLVRIEDTFHHLAIIDAAMTSASSHKRESIASCAVKPSRP